MLFFQDSDSDEEYFDATDTIDANTYVSPSISISTIEGDPPEIEEDKDFNEVDNSEGRWFTFTGEQM